MNQKVVVPLSTIYMPCLRSRQRSWRARQHLDTNQSLLSLTQTSIVREPYSLHPVHYASLSDEPQRHIGSFGASPLHAHHQSKDLLKLISPDPESGQATAYQTWRVSLPRVFLRNDESRCMAHAPIGMERRAEAGCVGQVPIEHREPGEDSNP